MLRLSIVLIVSLAALIGLLLGWLGVSSMTVGLLITTLVALLIYHLTCLARLYRWAAQPRQHEVPTGLGFWGRTLDRIGLFMRQEALEREAMSTELERMYAAVDQVPEGLIVLDQAGHVQWSNRAAQDLLGIFGTRRPIDHFIRHPDFIGYLHKGEFTHPVVVSLPSAPDRTYALKIEPTTETYRLLISRDVTHEVRTDQMRRDFVANVSHEIRTPLTVIAGFVETLLDMDLPPATQRECLETVQRQTTTMQRLVEDLLTLSTIEHALQDPALEPIAMTPLLETIATDMRALSGGSHHILVESAGPHRVLGAPNEIDSAVRNLVSNAVRYTPSGGQIVIRWQNCGTDAVLSVIDTGIGIAAEHLPRLTERFYRVDRGRSRDSGGTGLGLAIVKHVAQRHQIQLQIDSRPGQGSTFSLRFPGHRVAPRALL